jgi:hypothetical protein
MKSEHGRIEGDHDFTGREAFHGMLTGSATVKAGSHLELHGKVSGDLQIEPDASVDLHGMVDGAVTNAGGFLRFYGTVGDLIHEAGRTLVHPKAVVRGRVVGETEPMT